jgi:hypothetical protein
MHLHYWPGCAVFIAWAVHNFFIMGHSYGAVSSKWLAKNLGSEIQGSIHSAAQTVASPRMRAYGYSVESLIWVH